MWGLIPLFYRARKEYGHKLEHGWEINTPREN